MALAKFNIRTLRIIAISGLVLSAVCIIAVLAALATGNFDSNVASIIPTAVLGIAVYYGMRAVYVKRLADHEKRE